MIKTTTNMHLILHPVVMWLVVKEFQQVKGHMALSIYVQFGNLYLNPNRIASISNPLIIRWYISQYDNIQMIRLYFKKLLDVVGFPLSLKRPMFNIKKINKGELNLNLHIVASSMLLTNINLNKPIAVALLFLTSILNIKIVINNQVCCLLRTLYDLKSNQCMSRTP